MNFVEKKTLTNSEERTQLREANRLYTECLSRDFLSRWLAGEPVNVNDFCVQERSAMHDLDKKVYGDVPF